MLVEAITPAPLEVRLSPEEGIALLQHSSGTTGLKKGVALSYAAIADQIESYSRALELSPADVIVSWLPLYHDMGLIACLMMPAYLAIPFTHIDPLYWVGRPGALLDSIVAHRGTFTWQPNFAFDHLSGTVSRRAAEWDLSRMRAFINCSEPCRSASLDRFASAFAGAGIRLRAIALLLTPWPKRCSRSPRPRLEASRQPGFGWTRPACIAEPAPRSHPPGEGVELVESGSVVEGLTVSIHDENGGAIADDLVGEIGIRGRFLFSGYNHDRERTAERLRGDIYLTRDLGFLRRGHLYVLGRLDDLLIINGRNLYAHEIEAAVTNLPGVKRGRTVALAWFDPRIGSESLVLMAERDRGTPRPDEDLRREISTIVHSVFNVTPRAIQLVDEGRLIKTTSGKISRKENLARFLEARV